MNCCRGFLSRPMRWCASAGRWPKEPHSRSDIDLAVLTRERPATMPFSIASVTPGHFEIVPGRTPSGNLIAVEYLTDRVLAARKAQQDEYQRALETVRLARERLTESSHGPLLFELAHPRADGTTHRLREPLELIEKMALLIPPLAFIRGAFRGCSARARRGGRRSFPGVPMLSMKQPRGRGEARGGGRGRSRRPGRWVRLVRGRRGRCGGGGCSPWTSFRVRAAAAGGGSWGCTPEASAFVSCSSGSGSSAHRPPRPPRARRRGGERNRPRPLVGIPSAPRAPHLSPSSASRRRSGSGRARLASQRGQGCRRLAARLSPTEGHGPCRALDFALRGRDRGARQASEGESWRRRRGFWNSDALGRPAAA
jgi:Putative transposase